MNTIPLRLKWLEAVLWLQTRFEAHTVSRKIKKNQVTVQRREKKALLKLLR